MISWLLFQEIAKLFIALIMGWLLVRFGKAKSSDSRYLSTVILYLINPCVIITAYQIEISAQRLHAMLFSLGAAVFAHLLMLLVTALLRKPLRLNPVEQASSIYSNCVNLLVPVIGSILGKEWILFTSMYMMIQISLLWSHCRMLLSGEKKISFRNIFGNLNVISILIGLALFLLRLPIPPLLSGAMESVGSMLGPLSMVIIGMLIGGVDLKQAIRIPGVWKVTALRLIVYPLVALLIFKFSGLAALVPDGENILLITLLAVACPSGTMVVQIAQIYSDDGPYASAINVVSTLLCIVTMPLIIMLYQL